MDAVVIHPVTEAAILAAIKARAHAILLAGPTGSGKATLAQMIAQHHLGLTAAQLAHYAYHAHIQPTNGTITIDAIRSLRHFLSLSTTGKQAIRRVVIIEDADAMGDEAQNALLKALEEPPVDTVFVLTAADVDTLKPTIHSRTQRIAVLPPQKAALVTHFSATHHTTHEVEKAHRISGGLPGLMHALLEHDTEHPLAAHIALAKQLLASPPYQRQLSVDELSKQRAAVVLLVSALKRICLSALEQAAQTQQTTAAKAWHKRLQLVRNAEDTLQYNANLKLLLTDLFLQL